jgi:hypothetical protein
MELKLIVHFFLVLIVTALHVNTGGHPPVFHWYHTKPTLQKKISEKKKRKENLEYNVGWWSTGEDCQRIKVMAFPHWATNNHQSQIAVTSQSPNSLRHRELKSHFFLLFGLNIIDIIHFFLSVETQGQN